MSLSYEEAVHEAVTNVLEGSYRILKGPEDVKIKLVTEAAVEAIEDWVVHITNGEFNMQEVIG